MVMLNTDIGEDEDHDKVHLFLSHKTEDNLLPVALCGDMSMGHFHLEPASEAVQVLPVPTEKARKGLWASLRHLQEEYLLCEECTSEYLDATREPPQEHEVDVDPVTDGGGNFWWAAKPGELHIWTREPHVDTPALCGEWAREWDTNPLAEHPMVKDGTKETLEEFIRLVAVCDECRETARERYGFTA